MKTLIIVQTQFIDVGMKNATLWWLTQKTTKSLGFKNKRFRLHNFLIMKLGISLVIIQLSGLELIHTLTMVLLIVKDFRLKTFHSINYRLILMASNGGLFNKST